VFAASPLALQSGKPSSRRFAPLSGVFAVDIYKALQALYEERKKLDDVIVALEELQRKSALRALQQPDVPRRRGRKYMDAEGRKQVSERMKAYWANRKKKVQEQSGAA
jgi:hypothetical protein